MNGGKDVKIGHDKRPVSVIPSDEQPLYNIANGELLTDEFGNPLITKVDQFFLADASKDRATSVVFPENPEDKYNIKTVTQVGLTTATYGIDLDVNTRINTSNKVEVLQVGGSIVEVGPTVLQVSSGTVTFTDLNACEILTVATDVGKDKNNLYFPASDMSYLTNVGVGISFKVSGHNIPAGSYVLKKDFNRIKISQPSTAGITTGKVTFFHSDTAVYTSDNVLKIAEVFRETSEVSSTLLGVNRAETQLSLFSNVSSYGLNNDEWEQFSYNTGITQLSWENRVNEVYGRRYLAKIDEETQESAIKLSAFPCSHSFPFGPLFEKIAGVYNPTLYQQYLSFIRLGNLAYILYTSKLSGYASDWTEKFLNPNDVRIDESTGDIVYSKLPDKIDTGVEFDYAFSKIDKWTDTWRDIGISAPDGTTGLKSVLDPISSKYLSFASLKDLLGTNGLTNIYDGSNTRPGYYTNYRRFSAIQSRRVFRYQPGRISGFTFGLRSSTEPVPGVALEWGITNSTDHYVFKIYAGQLSIVRRSTVPLSTEVLIRNGLDPNEISSIQINGTSYNTVQPEIASGDPFDVVDSDGPLRQDEYEDPKRARLYHTIEIPRDKFNGDPLNGNGPSGYTIRPEKVTMWKIEFGWYGAIGARFYAYIPSGAGEARWVVIHTLVIENSLTGPCLRDSYFRFKYSLDVFNTANLKTPQFLYKYGASYYIDGGDEGTSEIYSVSTGLTPKQINDANETSLFSVRPKDLITNSAGVSIQNRKLILPTKFNISTNTLTEVKVKTCRACQGHGHVFTPGVRTTASGRSMTIKFDDTNLITAVGSGVSFTSNDIGAKLIAPSIFNAYITDMDEGTATEYPNGFKTYESAKVYGWGPGLDGYPSYNKLGGTAGRGIGGSKVRDYAAGITTTIATGVGATYPHLVRFSNYDVHFASDFPLTGSEIKIQFINPNTKDGSSANPSSHWADFMIGVTDKKPSINSGNPNILDGWDSGVLPWTDYSNLDSSSPSPGIGNTSILPESEILFGEHTHSWAGMNEDGVEFDERWAPTNFRVRMNEDVRIPSVSSTSGGFCSSVKITVSDSLDIATQVQEVTTNPHPDHSDIGFFLKVEGTFGGGITDWVGGQVAVLNSDGSVNQSNAKFELTKDASGDLQRTPVSYTSGGSSFQYVKISESTGLPDSEKLDITLVGRAVKLEGNRLNVPGGKIKLFKYDVYPLYLVGKLMDNARINNISIKEKSGEFQKTTAPIISVSSGSNGIIDLANDGSKNNTTNDNTPPTNFLSVERLSSSTVDTQNQQTIRPSITKDIFYIGENKTEQIDMTKVFGVDRNVITPDNNNIEATFFTAKQLGSGGSKFVQGSLNYREQ